MRPDFIVEQSTEIDDLGFVQTRSKLARGKSKTKGKQPKQRKNVQKSKYTFNRASLSTPEYSDYFNPDHRVESRLLDLPQTVRCSFCLFIGIRIHRSSTSGVSRKPT